MFVMGKNFGEVPLTSLVNQLILQNAINVLIIAP